MNNRQTVKLLATLISTVNVRRCASVILSACLYCMQAHAHAVWNTTCMEFVCVYGCVHSRLCAIINCVMSRDSVRLVPAIISSSYSAANCQNVQIYRRWLPCPRARTYRTEVGLLPAHGSSFGRMSFLSTSDSYGHQLEMNQGCDWTQARWVQCLF